MNNFGEFIVKSFNCLKPFISKNILAFIVEVLNNSVNSGLQNNIVSALIPLILQKAVSPNKITAMMSDKAFESIILYCLSDEVIQVLCTNSATKNKQINKKSFSVLLTAISSVKERIPNFNSETLKIIFQCMAFNLISDCAENKSGA